MTSRMSPGRRIMVIVTVVLGLLAWSLALIGWTALGRVSDNGGFVDVTVETIQSPAGLSATSHVLVTQVDAAAKSSGNAISPQGQQALDQAVTQVLSDPDLGTTLEGGIVAARDALAQRPDDGITIDASALRDKLEAALKVRNPQLAAQVPLAGDLVITVPPGQVPPAVSTAGNFISAMRWVPLALVGGTIVLLGIAFLVTDDRSRTARRVGIALVVLGVLPLVMRLVLPPVVGGAAGDAGSIAEVATTATIANWWIALLVTVVVGVAMWGLGTWLRQPTRRPGGPTVLGR